MYRGLTLVRCIAVILFGGALQAQAQFTINAAAEDAVPGWQKMEIEGRAVWVNPTPALTSADIQGVQGATNTNYGNFVKVLFTDAGARKMRELGTLRYMLPWMASEIEEIDTVFGGDDAWPYGIEPNRATLEALVQYLADQALIEKPVPLDELFVPIYGQEAKG